MARDSVSRRVHPSRDGDGTIRESEDEDDVSHSYGKGGDNGRVTSKLKGGSSEKSYSQHQHHHQPNWNDQNEEDKGHKRNWMRLEFVDEETERDFQAFALEHERRIVMVASTLLLLLCPAIVIVVDRSVPFNNMAIITWVVPELILATILLAAFYAAYIRNQTMSTVSTMCLVFYSFWFYPVWVAFWEPSSTGPSVLCIVLLSFSLMAFPCPLHLSLAVTCFGLISLIASASAMIAVQPGVDGGELFPNITSGYDTRFNWGSSIFQYSLVACNAWLYCRFKQRGLRRLFLIRKRRQALITLVESSGGFREDTGLIHIHKYRSDMALAKRAMRRMENGSREQLNMHERRGSRETGNRPHTARSMTPSMRADWDGPLSRPGTAGHKMKSGIFGSLTSRFEDRRAQSIQINPFQGLSTAVKEGEPKWFIIELFLGQPPWSSSIERRYLKSKARFGGPELIWTFMRLALTNAATSVFDHLDRVRLQGSQLDSKTILARFLALLVPCTIVPLMAALVAHLLLAKNKPLLFQPLVLLAFSGLAAAYLLSPMEIMSQIHPDSFPQAKATAYLITTLICAAQSAILPARSFVAWCVSLLFLTLSHIPLVIAWGGDFDSRMPWGMALEVATLLVSLAAMVRFTDALARDAYETLQMVRALTRLASTLNSTSRLETYTAASSRKGSQMQFHQLPGLGRLPQQNGQVKPSSTPQEFNKDSIFNLYNLSQERVDTKPGNNNPVKQSSPYKDKLNDLLAQCNEMIILLSEQRFYEPAPTNEPPIVSLPEDPKSFDDMFDPTKIVTHTGATKDPYQHQSQELNLSTEFPQTQDESHYSASSLEMNEVEPVTDEPQIPSHYSEFVNREVLSTSDPKGPLDSFQDLVLAANEHESRHSLSLGILPDAKINQQETAPVTLPTNGGSEIAQIQPQDEEPLHAIFFEQPNQIITHIGESKIRELGSANLTHSLDSSLSTIPPKFGSTSGLQRKSLAASVPSIAHPDETRLPQQLSADLPSIFNLVGASVAMNTSEKQDSTVRATSDQKSSESLPNGVRASLGYIAPTVEPDNRVSVPDISKRPESLQSAKKAAPASRSSKATFLSREFSEQDSHTSFDILGERESNAQPVMNQKSLSVSDMIILNSSVEKSASIPLNTSTNNSEHPAVSPKHSYQSIAHLPYPAPALQSAESLVQPQTALTEVAPTPAPPTRAETRTINRGIRLPLVGSNEDEDVRAIMKSADSIVEAKPKYGKDAPKFVETDHPMSHAERTSIEFDYLCLDKPSEHNGEKSGPTTTQDGEMPAWLAKDLTSNTASGGPKSVAGEPLPLSSPLSAPTNAFGRRLPSLDPKM